MKPSIVSAILLLLLAVDAAVALAPPTVDRLRQTTTTTTQTESSATFTAQSRQENTRERGDECMSDLPSSRRAFLTAVASASVVLAGGGGEEARAADTSTTNTVASTSNAAAQTIDWQGILKKSSKRALGGGKAGAAAAVVQVCSLMWLRTSMNYQYRYGGNLQSSLATLWSEGGIPRLYQGLPFALIQGPLTRFGDTAANVGVLVLLDSLDATRDMPIPLKTACGSLAAGAWRIVLMPIDASKTAMQVEGAAGLERLRGNLVDQGPRVLYRGALAQASATAAGHFPWFLTYNFLNEQLPAISSESDLFLYLVRSAFMGLSASCVSDTVSNSLRVLKTTRQTAQVGDDAEDLSYPEIAKLIIEQDGVLGLLGRGLQTRLLTNAIQGAVFSVCWRYFQQLNGLQ